jgi:hypothetical protein
MQQPLHSWCLLPKMSNATELFARERTSCMRLVCSKADLVLPKQSFYLRKDARNFQTFMVSAKSAFHRAILRQNSKPFVKS